jgi:hypothetical protein
MSPETIAELQRRLLAESMALWTSAAERCREASATRAMVAEHVRRSPIRRMARLAQGGRDDGNGDQGSAPDGKLVETREPRCPHCQTVRIRRLEKMEIVEGRVKTDCECLVCEKVFVYSRKATA